MSASQPQARELRGGSSILSSRVKEAGRAVLSPIVRLAVRAGITPNTVTVTGFILVVIATLLVATGQLVVGAAVLTVGALLDAVDGAVARATGGDNAFGSFLDSTLDRAAEAIMYAGIVAYYLRATVDPVGPVVLAVAALTGSFMVSYTRAKAESIGLTASVGLAPRTERLVLIVTGIALTGLGLGIGLVAAMAIIAVLATATTIQRIWHVRSQLAGQELAGGTSDTTREK